MQKQRLLVIPSQRQPFEPLLGDVDLALGGAGAIPQGGGRLSRSSQTDDVALPAIDVNCGGGGCGGGAVTIISTKIFALSIS
ncbi:hypothetical protein Ddye_013415 [Dipteronia dyeriana]|uniref:Uncharacterized protein n=1 Tax=Dipteronia dyeriana TaxID=168575 RepID=A0AAE0CJL8_9ROSI|nr:hypothetical protein Ddye_013415 [Dipteronia dyeriana]